jgi:uncharacterized protein YbaA (DUF1428 family)
MNIIECWGDDVPERKLTSFPMTVKQEANETVYSRGSAGLRGKHATKPGRT